MSGLKYYKTQFYFNILLKNIDKLTEAAKKQQRSYTPFSQFPKWLRFIIIAQSQNQDIDVGAVN